MNHVCLYQLWISIAGNAIEEILKPGSPLQNVVPQPDFITVKDGKLSISETFEDEYSMTAWLPQTIKVQDGRGNIYESTIYDETEYAGFDSNPDACQTWIISASDNEEAPTLVLEVSLEKTTLTLLSDVWDSLSVEKKLAVKFLNLLSKSCHAHVKLSLKDI